MDTNTYHFIALHVRVKIENGYKMVYTEILRDAGGLIICSKL